MSFDNLVMQTVTAELGELLTGAFVQRVTAKAWNEILIDFYSPKGLNTLLFSLAPEYARLHLIARAAKGSKEGGPPSAFTMLLRKYLVGAKALGFSNPPFERVLSIAFKTPAGLPNVTLIAEIMNRRSNLVLVDEKNIILGAAKTANAEKNPRRPVLSGLAYTAVPPQPAALSPGKLSGHELKSAMEAFLAEGKDPARALTGSVKGLSPLIATELLYRAGWQDQAADKPYDHLALILNEFFFKPDRAFGPPVLYPEKGLYAMTALTHLGNTEERVFATANTLLEKFYSETIEQSRQKVLKERLLAALKTRQRALLLKQKRRQEELLTTEKAPAFRLFAETLLTFGAEVPKGARTAVLPNLYHPEEKVVIPLNPAKNAAANARYYFSRYRKAKDGRDKVLKQLALTENEKLYLADLLYSIERASGEVTDEIKEELVAAGYIKDKGLRRPLKISTPAHKSFETTSGFKVLVGKNNRGNDFVTFKVASRRDTWFHAQKLPGSHVVIKNAGRKLQEADCLEAALLAAYFSKGHLSHAVAVDYTEIRHVRRRPGGKPGQVFYEQQHTLTVNPQDSKMKERFGLP